MEPHPLRNDDDVVCRAQSGDRSAFDALAKRHYAAVKALAFSRTGDMDAADDLAQEIFMSAWSCLGSLNDPAAFLPWLKRIAVNACASWHRRRRWPRSLEDPALLSDLPTRGDDPYRSAVRKEREMRCREALLQLPQSNRIALLMHVWGGHSYEEIAAFLEVPLTTIEGRIHRARRQLRHLLREEAADLPGLPRKRWKEKTDE